MTREEVDAIKFRQGCHDAYMTCYYSERWSVDTPFELVKCTTMPRDKESGMVTGKESTVWILNDVEYKKREDLYKALENVVIENKHN